jgi:hypothetical protein
MLMTTHWAYALILMSLMVLAEIDVSVSVLLVIAGSDGASLLDTWSFIGS